MMKESGPLSWELSCNGSPSLPTQPQIKMVNLLPFISLLWKPYTITSAFLVQPCSWINNNVTLHAKRDIMIVTLGECRVANTSHREKVVEDWEHFYKADDQRHLCLAGCTTVMLVTKSEQLTLKLFKGPSPHVMGAIAKLSVKEKDVRKHKEQ